MEEKFSRLQKVLGEEKAVYSELVEMAREKQNALVKNDLEGINGAVQKEEEVLGRIEEKEKERKGILKELGVEEENFAGLCRKAGPGQAEKLRETRNELLLLLEELWEINETNNRLIKDSLQFNNNLVQSLAKIRGSDTYSQKGSQESTRSFLDKKA